jgi:hypothetical protein
LQVIQEVIGCELRERKTAAAKAEARFRAIVLPAGSGNCHVAADEIPKQSMLSFHTPEINEDVGNPRAPVPPVMTFRVFGI